MKLGECRLRRAEICLTSEVNGEIVFFHPVDGKYFASTPVGCEIWRLLESPRSVNELTRKLIELYDVSEETCHNDVEQFVGELVQKQLVEIVE